MTNRVKSKQPQQKERRGPSYLCTVHSIRESISHRDKMAANVKPRAAPNGADDILNTSALWQKWPHGDSRAGGCMLMILMKFGSGLKVPVLLPLLSPGSQGRHGSVLGRRIATVAHCLPLALSMFSLAWRSGVARATLPLVFCPAGHSHNPAINYAEEHRNYANF